MERRTLTQLRSVQAWLAAERGLPVSIGKPMYDVGSRPRAGGTSFPDASRPSPADVTKAALALTLPTAPCIPDFIVRAGSDGTAMATVIVETMGYADAVYRGRKAEMHALMSASLAGAPVLSHDFYEPPGETQAWRDTMFWRALRNTLADRAAARERDAARRRRDGTVWFAGQC